MIPMLLVEEAIAEYKSFDEYQTDLMKKAMPSTKVANLFTPYVEEVWGKKIELAGGNYYEHSFPYLPHTDYNVLKDNIINAVIPLMYECEVDPYLVVFDQIYRGSYPVTWMMHWPMTTLHENIALYGPPHKYCLDNLTDRPIDNDLYKYIDMYPKELLYGLSGAVHKFEPGNLIVFDNRKIHCTSNYKGTKLGLSLRFKEL